MHLMHLFLKKWFLRVEKIGHDRFPASAPIVNYINKFDKQIKLPCETIKGNHVLAVSWKHDKGAVCRIPANRPLDHRTCQ